MSYIHKLREHNAQIQELVKSINTFTSNQKLYDMLRIEVQEKRKELERLKNKWSSEYVPALELRQKLRSELYMAEHQRASFEEEIRQKCLSMSIMEVEKYIDQLNSEKYEARYPTKKQLMTPSLDPPSVSPNSSTGSIDGYYSLSKPLPPSVTNLEENQDPIVIKEDLLQEKKVGHMWSLTSAEVTLQELSQEYANTKTKRRSLGSRTCAIQVELKALDIEIVRLQSSMYIPPELLYSDLLVDVNYWKIKFYTTELYKKKSLQLQLPPKLADFF